ncbi:MAG: alpha/beta fold hydrolase [Patescibacteria group bacterium]
MKNFRKYGRKPYKVILLHGGPGAPGTMKPVALRLAKKFGVLEYLQTAQKISGQLLEIKKIISQNTDSPIIVIGHSWGAMLGYIFAARYPKLVKKLIMIGSGVYEKKYAKNIMFTRISRMSKAMKNKYDDLLKKMQESKGKKRDLIFKQIGQIIAKVDNRSSFNEPVNRILPNYDNYRETWEEVERLRSSGKLLQMGRKILCPVVAIHGDYDPHPIEGIKKPLEKVLADFSLIVLNKCGHQPWLERQAKDEFWQILAKEVVEQKKVIIFFGTPGSGKSYLGKRLAKSLGYYFYEADNDYNIGGYRERMDRERKDLVLADFYEKMIVKIEKYRMAYDGVVIASALGTDRYRRFLEGELGKGLFWVWVKPVSKKHWQHILDREKDGLLIEDKYWVDSLKKHWQEKIRTFEKPTVEYLEIKNDYNVKTEKDLLKKFVKGI